MSTNKMLLEDNSARETKDIIIYGYGKIGKAIKLLAERAKENNLYFNSDIYTIDTNGTAQFQNIEEIKDIQKPMIHVIAIDTGIDLVDTNENGFIPNTYKIKSLINEIISERGTANPHMDAIIVESTVEIGFYDSLKEELKDTPNWPIYISPERYNENTLLEDGFTMDQVKICGIDLNGNEENLEQNRREIDDYLTIFNDNDITIVICSPQEAEATKVVENAYRYLTLSFTNELQWSLSNKLDTELIMGLVGTKTGLEYLNEVRPGLIGGGCIPIDPLYLPNLKDSLISNVIKNEAKRLTKIVNTIINLIENSNLKRIALMGISYKPNSTSMKDSSYVTILSKLNKHFQEKFEKTEDRPTIYVLDHLALGTKEELFTPESLSAMQLILIGANHGGLKDYKQMAIESGTNVFDLNNLSVYAITKQEEKNNG